MHKKIIFPISNTKHLFQNFEGKALQANDRFYFFTRMSQSRGTPNGYWSQVGSDEQVRTGGGRDVGSKKTLVFYIRDSQERIKTNWVMHEFHLLDGSHSNSSGGSANSRTKNGHSTKVIVLFIFLELFDRFNIFE